MTAITHRDTNTLALAAQAMQLLDFGAMLVKSRMLPQSVQSPEAAVAIMVKGMELGLPAMAALNGITIIQGKPTVSPQLMLSLIKRSGQAKQIEIATGKDGATVKMVRLNGDHFTTTFGPNEAQLMGLNTKDNYKKQAPVMYQWRAVAACARVVFPDVIDGLYTPEEMGADVQVDEDGAMTVTVQQENVRTDKTPPVDPVHEAKMAKWAEKIGDMAVRVRKVAPEEEVSKCLDAYQWRTDSQDASRCYEILIALGTRYAPKKDAPPAAPQPQEAPAPVQVEELATPEQIKALQAFGRSAGATTSDERALLWAYMANEANPVHTKNLTEEQAAALIDSMTDLDAGDRKQAMDEAKKAAKGQLL